MASVMEAMGSFTTEPRITQSRMNSPRITMGRRSRVLLRLFSQTVSQRSRSQ